MIREKKGKFYRFYVYGKADIPEPFWNMGFTNEYEAEDGYIVHLTRGVS